MLFNSFEFLLFFPLVTLMYFALPHRFRWQLLLTASCVFYMAFIPKYILILALTIVIDYFAGLWLGDKRIAPRIRKTILISSIVSTCLILFIFKYFNFFNTNLAAVSKILGWNYSLEALEIILPIGLSFHTFQSLSYVIEVYRGNEKPERHFGIYALYVMFYPQLVAGPIERPQNLLHQFHSKHQFDYNNATDGLKLMAWGLFKKTVIADRLAIAVNAIYGNPQDHVGWPLFIATVFFAFQIYCDFSGYSDIAIGSAKVMGFELMKNFDAPYFSKSVAEFWKRWHISLSTWFRDYVYIPLGGNRKTKLRWQLNLLLTFLLSGFWHGASWNYVIWGGLNGLYLAFSIKTASARNKVCESLHLDRFPCLHKTIQTLITFSLICTAWIFFRAQNLSDALYIVVQIPKGMWSQWNSSSLRMFSMTPLDLSRYDLAIAALGIGTLLIVDALQGNRSFPSMLRSQSRIVRWSTYFTISAAILLFGVFSRQEQFIYFQF